MKVRAIRAFIGAGVRPKPGDVFDIPDKWVDKYEERGLVARVPDKQPQTAQTYETKVVAPQTKEEEPEELPLTAMREATVGDAEELTVEDLEKSGSWYTFPDGTQVQGEKAARRELERYNATQFGSDNE